MDGSNCLFLTLSESDVFYVCQNQLRIFRDWMQYFPLIYSSGDKSSRHNKIESVKNDIIWIPIEKTRLFMLSFEPQGRDESA